MTMQNVECRMKKGGVVSGRLSVVSGDGGPKCCMVCKGKWHGEHGRRHKLGRIITRTMAAFIDAGG